MTVGPAGDKHRGLDAVDELLEIVELFLEWDFAVAHARACAHVVCLRG